MPEIAVITGGGIGIGRAVALELARTGAMVVISGRREAPLVDTVNLIASQGGKADYFVGDLGSAGSAGALFAYVAHKHGDIDILVNNAGIDLTGPFAELSQEKWQALLSVNLTAPYLLCHAVVPGMLRKKKGLIVNVSSVLGVKGIAWYTGYSASKAGLRGLTEALAEELQPHGIRVHCLCPGRVATDMQVRLGGERIAAICMRPEKVAAVVRSMAAGKSSFQTTVVIDDQPLLLRCLDLNVRLRWMASRFLQAGRSLLAGRR